MLQQQVMQQQFQGMQQAIQNMTPEDMQAVKDMLSDLNQMLDEKARGRRARTFQGFMDKWGQFFPGVENLDELIEQLQQRQAQMQSLLDSMSPEQRRELQQMMQSLLQDPGLRNELASWRPTWKSCARWATCASRYPFRGDDSTQPGRSDAADGGPPGDGRLERQMREADRHRRPRRTIDGDKLREPARRRGGQDQLEQLDQLTQAAGGRRLHREARATSWS